MKKMKIILDSDGLYRPKHDRDIIMFQHCTEGSSAVYDVFQYRRVFAAHGYQICIRDEKVKE